MNKKFCRSVFLAAIFAIAGLGVPASFALAQASMQDLLKDFESLSKTQQAAILKALNETPTTVNEEIDDPESTGSRDEPGFRSVGGEETREEQGETEETDAAEEVTLEAFGYELFAGEPSTFAPAIDIPVPVDYVVGPGDTIDVQLFGNQSANYRLVVNRDGLLGFPEIGPIGVAGLQFDEMRRLLQKRVTEQMIGVTASITMGPLRSIRVFILGEAYRPGSYTISSLATMTNALFVSGGISSIGSLRNVQLKRNGRLVTTLDLYDLLLRGDTSGDERLQPGDVIFIPPVGATVGVQGEVRRPAIYEIRYEKTIREVIKLAGGMLPSAYPEASQVARIDENRERTIVDLDLSTEAGLSSHVTADDFLTVFSVLDKNENIVILQGNVYRPGPYQWVPGMRLTDIISSLRDMRPNSDFGYVMIRREDPADGGVSVLSAEIHDALKNVGGDNDILLRPLDQITVFDLAQDRREFVDPVLTDLGLQSSRQNPVSEVRITGQVRAPGRYPLEQEMRITDLIGAGGFLLESAYALEAELARYDIDANQRRVTRLITIDLAAALSGDESANIILQSHDVLTIKEIPLWRELEVVTIEGEVRFPGTYPVQRGERLSSVLACAGGLTELAFPTGAIFLRENLRIREQENIDDLATRIERELQTADSDSD